MKTTASKTIEQYKQNIEAEVRHYCEKSVTPAARGSQYLELLSQNTERLQGSLVVIGYDMFNGPVAKEVLKAALAIEMLHAYLICLDKQVDIDQALRAAHEAEIIIANLDFNPEDRLKALSITNRSMMLATLARTAKASEDDKLFWLATELTLNPLHVGLVLAGANCRITNAVTPFAISLGRALLHKQDKTKYLEQCCQDLKNMDENLDITALRELLSHTFA